MENAMENFRRMMSMGSKSASSSPSTLEKTTSVPVPVSSPLDSEDGEVVNLPRPVSEGELSAKMAEEAAISAVKSLPLPEAGSDDQNDGDFLDADTETPDAPDTETSDAPTVPDTKTSDVPTVKDTETSDASTVPETETSDVPTAPDTKASDVPAVQYSETTDVPTVPDIKTSAAPTVPETETSDVPTVQDTETYDAPTVQDTETSEVPSVPDNEVSDVPAVPTPDVSEPKVSTPSTPDDEDDMKDASPNKFFTPAAELSTPGTFETPSTSFPTATPTPSATEESSPPPPPSIRAPLTVVEDEEADNDDDDDDDATSYGSMEERNTGSAGSLQQSPTADLGEGDLAGSLSAAQAALARLNELSDSGIGATDRSLLEGVDEDGFKARVGDIVSKKDLSMENQLVQNLVNELLPLVKELNNVGGKDSSEDTLNGMSNGDVVNGDEGRPVARITKEEESERVGGDGDDGGAVEAMDEEGDDDDLMLEVEDEDGDDEEGEANQGEAETGEGLRVRADRDTLGTESENGEVEGGEQGEPEEEGEEGEEEDDEEDEEWDEEEAEAFAALQNAVRAAASEGGEVIAPTQTDQSPPQPQGLGTGQQPLPARREGTGGGSNRISPSPGSTAVQQGPPPENLLVEENPEQRRIREKLMGIRVKLLRVASRLGQDHHNPVVAQVLYRLRLVEQMRSGGRPGGVSGASVDEAVRSATQLEETEGGDSNLEFDCTIMVLGKSGVGKSATINSLFGAGHSISAYQPATTKVTEFVSTTQGMKVRIIDTPGLTTAVTDQRRNEKILAQVKKHIKKNPPDIVLYVDRLDVQPAPFGDLPLLRTLTETFGQALWFNAMVVFTHAAASPPDDARGNQMSYETYQAQRSYTVQQSIRQSAGDMRLMNPVALAENHPNCRTNRAGDRVLPNGQLWRPQLLLLCFSSKILAEANSLWRAQDAAGGMSRMGGGGGGRTRSNTLPFLLSQLLLWHDPLRLPDDQMGAEEDELEEIFGDEVDEKEEDEYDLPPFNPLSKEQLAKLTPQQQRDYHEELEDREKIFRRREFKESIRRRREMKRRATEVKSGFTTEETSAMEEEEEAQRNAAVPVAMPDLLLPPSFDSDNPVYRYRALETGTWLIRPLLEQHGWDHDAGYDAFSVERGLAIAGMPANINGQISKDKKDAQVALEAALSRWHGEPGPFTPVTTAGLDVHTVGKDLAYTLHAGTRVSNFKRNKTGAGLALTLLGEAITYGLKLEDRLSLGKRGKLTLATGILKTRGDQAVGGNMEVTIHHSKDYPLDRSHTTFAATAMDWQGELALGANVQTSFSVGKTSLTCRSNLNNRGAGLISIRAHSNEQMYMALVGFVPLVQHFIGARLLGHHGQN